MLWGRLIGVAHAKVYDILPSLAGCIFQVVDNGKNVGGETLNAGEVFHGPFNNRITGLISMVRMTADPGGVQLYELPQGLSSAHRPDIRGFDPAPRQAKGNCYSLALSKDR
jgi:hypothetical protein